MDPFLTRDYGEGTLPLDIDALTILQIVDLCSAGLVDCSTPRQVALGADYRALYGLKRQGANIPSKVSELLSSHYSFLSQLVSSLFLSCAWFTINTLNRT